MFKKVLAVMVCAVITACVAPPLMIAWVTTDGADNTARADLSGFPDAINISDFAQDAVSWCIATGIFETRDGRLAAWETATRAELAVMLSRYLAVVEQ